ncbi:MAG: GYDIA family GHMP kinase [Psychroflexus sp.]
MKSQRFYSHGKLLLTGEYLVLDGAQALAIPCKFGQHLEVIPSEDKMSTWVSYDNKNHVWLNLNFDIKKLINQEIKGKDDIEKRLFQILIEAYRINPKVFTQNYNFKTQLEFPKNWGLGTSSTLISNVAKWADVNPYQLLAKTFGGSGYDIACAESKSALVYSLEDKKPSVRKTKIPEALKPFIYFVHLEEKQNSREAISNYRNIKPVDLGVFISKINSITQEFQKIKSLKDAQEIILTHEEYLSEILKIEPVQLRLFSDFNGAIKSLGAWGGDFIMAICETDPSSYFKNKGYTTILTYEEMSL